MPKTTSPATCIECGATFQRKHKTHTYCSPECRAEVGRRNARERMRVRTQMLKAGLIKERPDPRPCVMCGATFQPKNTINVCCSPECSSEHEHQRKLAYAQRMRQTPEYHEYRYEYNKRYREENREKVRLRQREYMRERMREKRKDPAFIEQQKVWNQRYQQSEKGRDNNRSGKRRYMARRAQVPTEMFRNNEIHERDGYRCHICGRKTRPDYKPSHPLYPHLDHIIPISKGGSHTRDNVACCCHECNIKKGNRAVGEQLRLIG